MKHNKTSKPMDTTYLGIVLSGSRLMIGEVNTAGDILQHKAYKLSFFNQESALDIIHTSMEDYVRSASLAERKPAAIGVGLIGRVNADEGMWYQIDSGRTHPINVAREITNWYGIPCFTDNDVKSETRAIMRWGLGQKTENFVYLHTGTGIAAGLVIDGKPIRGSHFNAGEVGHLRVGVRVGLKCPCGRMDCIETIASSVGIDRQIRFLKRYYDTQLQIPQQGERVSVDEVYRLCREGDPLCMKVVDNAAEAMASLIMNLVRVSDPDTVILAGEMLSDGFLLEQIRQRLQPVTMRFVTGGVVLTQLDAQYIGLLGAGALAIDGSEGMTTTAKAIKK